jgi:hypothetical protein
MNWLRDDCAEAGGFIGGLLSCVAIFQRARAYAEAKANLSLPIFKDFPIAIGERLIAEG